MTRNIGFAVRYVAIPWVTEHDQIGIGAPWAENTSRSLIEVGIRINIRRGWGNAPSLLLQTLAPPVLCSDHTTAAGTLAIDFGQGLIQYALAFLMMGASLDGLIASSYTLMKRLYVCG